MYREPSSPVRSCFELFRLSFLLGLRLPGRDRSLIVLSSLLLFLSRRETCPLFHLLYWASSIVPLALLFFSSPRNTVEESRAAVLSALGHVAPDIQYRILAVRPVYVNAK